MNRAVPFEAFLRTTVEARLSPAQAVLVRVCFDGVDPVDLEASDREIAGKLFGDVDRVPADARHVVAWTKGARMGGTWICSLYLLYAALTADVSPLAPGEVAFAPIVAPDLRLARQALRYASGAANGTRSIKRLVEADTTEALTVRRPDGHLVTLECLPASRGGASTRGRSLVGALMDEASFFRDEDSQVNDAEVYRAIAPRILPGGRLCIISTAWTEAGLLYELGRKNHGAPVSALAAVCPTLLMRQDATIRRVVEQERARDPDNAAREFDCQTMSGGASTYFDPGAIARAVDPGLELGRKPAGKVAAGADFGFVRDSSALVAVEDVGGVVQVVQVVERRPERDKPLQPSSVVEAFAGVLSELGVGSVVADGHYRLAMAEYLLKHELHLIDAPEGQAGKVAMYSRFRTLLHEGRVRLPEHPRLLAQLRQVMSKPTAGGGLSVFSPRRAGQGHGDLVSAMVTAVHRLQVGGVQYPGAVHVLSERGRGRRGGKMTIRRPDGSTFVVHEVTGNGEG